MKTARRLSDATDHNASFTLGEDNSSSAHLQSNTSINSLNYSTSPALAPNSFTADMERIMQKNLSDPKKEVVHIDDIICIT